MSIRGSDLPRTKHHEKWFDLRLFLKYLTELNSVCEVVETEEGRLVKK